MIVAVAALFGPALSPERAAADARKIKGGFFRSIPRALLDVRQEAIGNIRYGRAFLVRRTPEPAS
jgi:hypothetical protein